MKVLTLVLMVLVGVANGNEFDYDDDNQEEFQLEEEILANPQTNKEKIQSLKQEIQNLNVQNENLEQTHYDLLKLYQNCSKEQEKSRALIKHLASLVQELNVRSFLENSLLLYAAENGQVEKVKTMLQIGIDVNVKNDSDWTPLHFATWNGHSTVASILLQKDARVDAITVYGSTPLHLAWKGGLKVAKVLVKGGAEIDARDVDQMTPLHWACEKGNLEVAEFLLQNGADLGAKDKDGLTPLYWAMNRRGFLKSSDKTNAMLPFRRY